MKRISDKNKTNTKRRGSPGMTLIEVVVAFGVLTLLFAAYATFMGQASVLNSQARQTDAMLQNANAVLETGGSAKTGSAMITFNKQGGGEYDVNVDMYSVTEGDVTLSRFQP